MGTKHRDWWSYTKSIIWDYPMLKRRIGSIGITSVVPAYGASRGRGSEISRPVERAVVDRLTDKEQRRFGRPRL